LEEETHFFQCAKKFSKSWSGSMLCSMLSARYVPTCMRPFVQCPLHPHPCDQPTVNVQAI